MLKKYRVEFSGGESRQQPEKGCDYMICAAWDKDGDPVELYAEIVSPEGLTIEDADAWSDSVYDDLKAEIIRQAKDYGITAEQLEF